MSGWFLFYSFCVLYFRCFTMGVHCFSNQEKESQPKIQGVGVGVGVGVGGNAVW